MATAKAVVAAGFPVVATTSGGVAATPGYEDQEGAPADEMLAAAGVAIGDAHQAAGFTSGLRCAWAETRRRWALEHQYRHHHNRDDGRGQPPSRTHPGRGIPGATNPPRMAVSGRQTE